MSDHFSRAITQARREPASTLVEALGIIASQERTIEVLTERLARSEALIRFANGVEEYAERREITAPPVRDADMAALMGAVEWQAPGRTVNWPGIGLLGACVASAVLVVWLVVWLVEVMG